MTERDEKIDSRLDDMEKVSTVGLEILKHWSFTKSFPVKNFTHNFRNNMQKAVNSVASGQIGHLV